MRWQVPRVQRRLGRVTAPASPPISVLESLVAAAVLAPSSHNTQPWLFELGEATITVIADRTRALPVNDPHDRELTISCGAALFNLEVAARERGYLPELELLPDLDQPDRLARITLRPDATGEGDPLFPAIAARRTTRAPFTDMPPPAGFGERLTAIAEQHRLRAHVITGETRARLADLVAEGDRSQFADPRWRRELASWMHPRRKGDGLVVPELVGLATRAVVTAFDVGKPTAKLDHELILAAPLVVVLASARDDARAWLEVGRGLQHLLLAATHEQVNAGYLNPPCQVEGLRGRLAQLLDPPGTPQLVLRFGKLADAPRATPRRPIDAVIER
jgi:hypothetical protein